MAAFGKVEPLLLDKLEDLFNYNLHKGCLLYTSDAADE